MIDIMDKNGISMIPVVEDDGRIIGICPRSNILKEILNERFVMIGRKKNYNNIRSWIKIKDLHTLDLEIFRILSKVNY